MVELVLFSLLVFFHTISNKWLNNFPSIGQVVLVALRFFMFLIGASLFVRLLAMVYRGRKHLPYNKKDNVTVGLSNIFIMVIAVYGFLSTFALFGIEIYKIFTTVSIVAAAIAIISKDFIADIISGIVISFSKEISIDDFVKIGDHKGKIVDINIAKTALLNEDDDIIFMPNSTVFTSDVINYTKKQIKKTSIDFEVATSSIGSVEELEEQLIESLHEYHHLIEPNSYFLRVVNIKKDFLILKFQYNLIQFSREMERQIKRKAVRSIVKNINLTKEKELDKSDS
ncbi:MAG: mechanosensitive ion channel [Saprospiraceae bacterium]|uniref:Mechanosensitive ion channel n=1 Tax=Candidatus Opimibacter skivensis TaxID=2982028 RepID=A0A9D7SQL8_9BACT|nr:mechanosensitive ion channel [Candidatus Opimibacter skivensis]